MGLSVACGSASARTSESLGLRPQTSKLRVTSRRQIFSSQAYKRGRPPCWGSGLSQCFPAPGSLSRGPPDSMPAPRPLGPRAPMSLCRSRRGNTRLGGQGHGGDTKNAVEARARGEAPSTVADPWRKKKKSRKRGFSGQTPRI